jgi:hypothetical protein
VSRSWLVLTIPVALASLGLLGWTALSLLRTVRASVVASLPVLPEQTVTINSSGDLSLNIESALLARRPTNLRFALASADGRSRIALTPVALQTHVSSMSRSRIELCAFTRPAPGAYVLRIDGIEPSANYADDAIVITRRYLPALVLHVLALIFLGAALIGSLVVSGLVASGKSFTAR